MHQEKDTVKAEARDEQTSGFIIQSIVGADGVLFYSLQGMCTSKISISILYWEVWKGITIVIVKH